MKTIAAVVTFALVAFAAPASARIAVSDCDGSRPAHFEQFCAKRNLHAAVTTLRWLGNHPLAGSPVIRFQLRLDHLWLRRVSIFRLAEARRRLAPPPTPQVGHRALWLCIHNGEGDWRARTGNGFYGGLQMTYGWNGLVGDAAQLTPDAQMQAAETGFRQAGYSTGWLRSQWPQTSLPCLGYAY